MAECFGNTDEAFAPTEIFCGPCQTRHDHVKSEFYCSTCEEGLCLDCNRHHMAIKTSRDHKTITIDKFIELQELIGKMSTKCQVHDLKLELYCPNHEKVCCSQCTDTVHSKCTGMKAILSYATTYQESNPYTNIDHKFKVVLNNLEKMTSDRSDNKQQVDMSRSTVKTKISKFCEDVTTALLRVADEVTDDVDRLALEKMSELDKVLVSLRQKKQEIESTKETYLACKEIGNNVQILTCCRKAEEQINGTNSFIEDLIGNGELTNATLELNLDEHFKKCVVNALKPSMRQMPSMISLERFDGAAQDISKLSAELNEGFNITTMDSIPHISCISSHSGVQLLVEYDNKKVWKLSNGNLVSMKYDGSPFALAVISNSTFALSIPSEHRIKFVNIEDFKEESELELENNWEPWGLGYNNGLLLIAIRGIEIQLRDIKQPSSVVKRLPCKHNEIYLHFKNDFYYLSDFKEHYVSCHSLENKEEIWHHQSNKTNGARNMCTDYYGNTFIACTDIDEVVVVSRDGTNCKTFLDFQKPKGICFEETKSLLFVCSQDGSDFKSYRVVYSLP